MLVYIGHFVKQFGQNIGKLILFDGSLGYGELKVRCRDLRLFYHFPVWEPIIYFVAFDEYP